MKEPRRIPTKMEVRLAIVLSTDSLETANKAVLQQPKQRHQTHFSCDRFNASEAELRKIAVEIERCYGRY